MKINRMSGPICAAIYNIRGSAVLTPVYLLRAADLWRKILQQNRQ